MKLKNLIFIKNADYYKDIQLLVNDEEIGPYEELIDTFHFNSNLFSTNSVNIFILIYHIGNFYSLKEV